MAYTVPKLKSYTTAALDKGVVKLLAALDKEAKTVQNEEDWKIFRDRWMARNVPWRRGLPVVIGSVDHSQDSAMQMTLAVGPLVALIAGILILIVPRLLNYIVAIYLIVMGLIGLFGSGAVKLP